VGNLAPNSGSLRADN